MLGTWGLSGSKVVVSIGTNIPAMQVEYFDEKPIH